MTVSSLRTSGDLRPLVFVGAYSAVLYSVLLIAPVIAGKLIAEFDLTPTQVGLVFSLELGAFSLATVPAYLWLRRANLKHVTIGCTLAVAVGNAVSGMVDAYPALLAARFFTALAAGSITVILLSRCSRVGNPSRAFGVFVVAQLAMGALILAVFPVLFAGVGVAAVYWTLAVLVLCCLPAARLLDGDFLRRAASAPTVVAAKGRHASRVGFVLALAALFAFYVALSGTWTFMAQVATAAGVGEDPTSLVLALATVAGIASALFASIRGDTPHRWAYLAGGYAAMGISVALLAGGPGLLRFALAAVVFKFAWTFILPYLLSTLADVGGGGGHVMNTSNLMIGSGFALGPLLGGALIEGTGGFGAMIAVSVLGVVLSGALVLWAHPRRGRGGDDDAPEAADATSAGGHRAP
ncbi:MFS transporter [Zhihengliuella halotolerans]|uniref:Putative MFS family arabinose efflux permease n=1 Tax=Zhihengliuella halotolerans TaxID=370736 RepID=A0A4Q8AA64_9MICC|nr:MFS transporter [Zhihengliuella halotolerans]RZU60541.1 putative MFS family arabinose efflux permease [Zhihengliuella halotolerans]